MSQEPGETLEVLRAVWTAQGQTSTDLDQAHGHKKSCKNMAHVGFDGLAGALVKQFSSGIPHRRELWALAMRLSYIGVQT